MIVKHFNNNFMQMYNHNNNDIGIGSCRHSHMNNGQTWVGPILYNKYIRLFSFRLFCIVYIYTKVLLDCPLLSEKFVLFQSVLHMYWKFHCCTLITWLPPSLLYNNHGGTCKGVRNFHVFHFVCGINQGHCVITTYV